MKKKILYLVCILVLVFCLVSCVAKIEEVSETEKAVQEQTITSDKNTNNEETKAPDHEHSYTVEESAPTCTDPGIKTYTCECSDTYTEEFSSAKGHEYNKEVVAPTCTNQGLTRYTCKVCSYTFSEAFVQPTGHSYTKNVVKATESAGGYTEYTCSVCSSSYKTDHTEKLPSKQETNVNVGSDNNSGGGAAQGMSFFDDAVFIGDSVSQMLEIYHGNNKCFGNATFLCETGLALYNYVADNKYSKVTYNGQSMKIENAVAACGAKKAFILLGTNDLVWADIDKTISNYKTLINNLRAKVPGIQIYIQSGTPIYTNGQRDGLTNVRMNEYNQKLKAMASSLGCNFIDIATPFKDSTGGLTPKYCSDSYVHLNSTACVVWVQTIKNYLGI